MKLFTFGKIKSSFWGCACLVLKIVCSESQKKTDTESGDKFEICDKTEAIEECKDFEISNLNSLSLRENLVSFLLPEGVQFGREASSLSADVFNCDFPVYKIWVFLETSKTGKNKVTVDNCYKFTNVLRDTNLFEIFRV